MVPKCKETVAQRTVRLWLSSDFASLPGYGNLHRSDATSSSADRSSSTSMHRLLPLEIIRRILLLSRDLQAAIDFELLQAGFDRRFHFRINSDPAAGPVADAVGLLLSDAWKNLTETSFPISLAISKFRFIEPADDVETVPAFKVAWIAKFRPDYFTYDYVQSAAGAGRLDLIRILDAYEIPKFRRGALDEAAANGHLSVLKFLHGRKYNNCSARAIDRAAAGGYLDVIKFLHEVCHVGCTDSALLNAVGNGNLAVVEYLQKEMKQEPPSHWSSSTVEFRVLRFLHEELGWPIVPGLLPHLIATAQPEDVRYYLERIQHQSPYLATMMFATTNSWLPMLKILHELHGENDDIWISGNWDELAKNGHGDMLEFLYENRHEGCSANGLSLAAQGGHVNVVKLLLSKGLEATQSLLEDAVLSDSVEMIKFCRSLPQLEGFWTASLATHAAVHGRFKSLRCVWDEYGLGLDSLERLELSGLKDVAPVDIALYAIQEKGISLPEQSFFQWLLPIACVHGTLEQVEAISKLTTDECPKAFEMCSFRDGLPALMLLCKIRAERPPEVCLQRAAWAGTFDTVTYLTKTIGMDLTAELLYYAAYNGNLEMVRELVDRLPEDKVAEADALLGAFRGEWIETVKFLHEKGVSVYEDYLCETFLNLSSLDVIEFALQNYEIDHESVLSRAIHQFENIDITERIYCSGGVEQHPDYFHYDPDLTQFAHDMRMIYRESDSVGVFQKDALCCFQILASNNYIDCHSKNATAAEHAVEYGAYRIIRYLSRQAPSIFKPSILTKAITAGPWGNGSSIAEFILDKHPDCWVPDEHLTLEPGTLEMAHVLWTKLGVRACPRAVMVGVCKEKLTGALKSCLKLMDPSSAVWNSAVEECLQVARSGEYFCEKAVTILQKACEA
ncbi:hypothetical protein HDU96_000516 [Phlyctochytrium bullatum]|nr:hypothetical protein HDU96_000516 [Phlyctochytrium bullatum]